MDFLRKYVIIPIKVGSEHIVYALSRDLTHIYWDVTYGNSENEISPMNEQESFDLDLYQAIDKSLCHSEDDFYTASKTTFQEVSTTGNSVVNVCSMSTIEISDQHCPNCSTLYEPLYEIENNEGNETTLSSGEQLQTGDDEDINSDYSTSLKQLLWENTSECCMKKCAVDEIDNSSGDSVWMKQLRKYISEPCLNKHKGDFKSSTICDGLTATSELCKCSENHGCLQVLDISDSEMLSDKNFIYADTDSASEWLYKPNQPFCFMPPRDVFSDSTNELQEISERMSNYSHFNQDANIKEEYIQCWIDETKKFCSNHLLCDEE